MNTTLAIEIAEALCIRWERVVLTPYLCAAGVPTIGAGATYYEDGTRVTLHDPAISRARAMQLLRWMIVTKYLPSVVELCPGLNSPQRLAAIIDFTFNLGSGNLRISNLRKRINTGRWDDVPEELRKWVWAGGVKLRGLANRREAEIALI